MTKRSHRQKYFLIKVFRFRDTNENLVKIAELIDYPGGLATIIIILL
jgi:hypothetical protein